MASLEKGTSVAGRFAVADEIASGGMGSVYRAKQTSLDREVALKVLHSDVAFTARARRRFGREARAVARLNHPHIASVYDFGTDNDDQTLWLAMELVDGVSLIELIHEPVDILRIVSLADQILSALSAAHARGIVHRDLKPSNILLTRDESDHEIIKLVDFGLAATHTDALDLDGAPGGIGDEVTEADAEGRRVILGTPRYMAPELFRQHPATPSVDLYALGIILFEILAGTPPYRGDDPKKLMRAHLRQPIPRLQPREGDVPPELERCIYRLLAKDVSERYESAAEVRQVLQNVLNQFSRAPWAVTGPGPAPADPNHPGNASHPGNRSRPGFLGGYGGGQTIPPSNLMRGDVSQFGPGGAMQAPLIGHNRERRSLERMVRNTVNSGEGGIAFVEGEAGIGKSRLLEWVRVRIQEAGVMRVAEGTFHRGSSAFGGVRDALADIFQIADVPTEQLAEHLAEPLSEWNLSTKEAELCLQLMTPGGDVAIFEEGGSEGGVSVQERVFAMIENVLRGAGSSKPWLLIFEDLHHAGDEALSFLQHLAVGMHLDPMPILIVGTVRAEEVDQVPEMRNALERLERLGPENVVRMTLEHLDLDQATDLVQKLAPIDDELARRIASRASGNPLHVTQIVGYLRDSDKLTWDDGRWSLAEGVDIHSELPDELADLMRYRLNRLASSSDDAEAVRAVLDRAAILGPRFDYALLRAFLRREPNQPWIDELDDVLERLVDDGYFREVGSGGRDTLEFTHVIMRDVLLKELEGRRSKRHLHRVAAEAKKNHYGERYHDRALEFVDHYRQAREPSGVYAYTVKAARNAAESADLHEAMRLYRDAKKLADDHQVSPENPVLDDVSDVLSSQEVGLEVAHLERRVGEYDSARDQYRKLLDDPDPAVALWTRWGLGEIDRRQGDLKDAASWFEDARKEVKEIWETLRSKDLRHTLQVVDTYNLVGLGRVAYARGLYRRAIARLEEGLEQAEKIDDRALQAVVLRLLTHSFWRVGQSRNAEVYFRRAAILEESLADPQLQAFGLRQSARFLREVGQPQKAKTQARNALEQTRELGQEHDLADCRLTLGQLAISRGDFKTAARHLRRAHEAYEKFRDRRGVARCNLALATLAFSVDRHKETQTLLLEAMDNLRAIGDLAALTEARFLYGRLQLEADRFDKALNTLTEAVQHFDRIDEQRLIICARAFYAFALKATGSHGEASLVVEKIIDDASEFGLAEESMADGLERLTSLYESDDPETADILRQLQQEVARRLGRPVASVPVR